MSFCFGPCVFSGVSIKETDKPSTPPSGQHSIKSLLASAQNLFSVTQKIWAKISIFFKKGNLLIHEATVLKVSSVLFSCSKFFFFPKKNYLIKLFFFASGSKIKQYVFFSDKLFFKKKSPCSILQIVTPFVG